MEEVVESCGAERRHDMDGTADGDERRPWRFPAVIQSSEAAERTVRGA